MEVRPQGVDVPLCGNRFPDEGTRGFDTAAKDRTGKFLDGLQGEAGVDDSFGFATVSVSLTLKLTPDRFGFRGNRRVLGVTNSREASHLSVDGCRGEEISLIVFLGVFLNLIVGDVAGAAVSPGSYSFYEFIEIVESLLGFYFHKTSGRRFGGWSLRSRSLNRGCLNGFRSRDRRDRDFGFLRVLVDAGHLKGDAVGIRCRQDKSRTLAEKPRLGGLGEILEFELGIAGVGDLAILEVA